MELQQENAVQADHLVILPIQIVVYIESPIAKSSTWLAGAVILLRIVKDVFKCVQVERRVVVVDPLGQQSEMHLKLKTILMS